MSKISTLADLSKIYIELLGIVDGFFNDKILPLSAQGSFPPAETLITTQKRIEEFAKDYPNEVVLTHIAQSDILVVKMMWQQYGIVKRIDKKWKDDAREFRGYLSSLVNRYDKLIFS